MNFKEKLKAAMAKKLKPQELLKYLCPFEVDFKLRIFANRNGHDYAILFQVKGDEKFIEDPRDLESFIAQAMAAKKINDPQITVTRVRYPAKVGEIYDCIYLDFKRP